MVGVDDLGAPVDDDDAVLEVVGEVAVADAVAGEEGPAERPQRTRHAVRVGAFDGGAAQPGEIALRELLAVRG